MAILSEPVFLKYEDIYSFRVRKDVGLAICQCPLPITDEGYYAHIVEYNKEYVCTKCNTIMMLVNSRDSARCVPSIFDFGEAKDNG